MPKGVYERNGQPKASSNPQAEAEFNLGHLYRTLEEHVESFAAQEGCPYSLAVVAFRMGTAFTARAKVWATLRDSQLLPEMRGASRQGHSAGNPQDLDVDAHANGSLKRTLSAAARARIAKAQRKRWRLARQKERAQREGWKVRKQAQRGGPPRPSKAHAISLFWGRMTPAEKKAFQEKREAKRKANAAKKAAA